MSALQNFTRASVDQAEPLEFPNRPKPPASALVTVQFQGVPVQLDLMTLDKDMLAQVESRITRLLERDGWGRPAAPQASPGGYRGGPRKKAEPPSYDDQGNPCCPIHGKVLKGPNQWRKYYCSAKDGDEYCKYTTAAE